MHPICAGRLLQCLSPLLAYSGNRPATGPGASDANDPSTTSAADFAVGTAALPKWLMRVHGYVAQAQAVGRYTQ